jgi:histidinol phosphatase-like PHP family hydrolase
VIAHGETIAKPVVPGTNAAALSSAYVDIPVHPSLIKCEGTNLAAKNDVPLEITSCGGDKHTNGHVLSAARHAGVNIVVESDAHELGEQMIERVRYMVARGAEMNENEAKRILSQTFDSLFPS